MRIGIRFGHMLSRADSGSVGFLSETDANRKYGPYVIKYLQQAGNEVINCTPGYVESEADSLCQGVDKANNSRCDLFVSLHANDGGGTGCEVIYYSGSNTGRELAQRISKSISEKLKYKNRGAKSEIDIKRDLYELKATNMTAVIVEPFFLDNQADCDKFNPEALGKAIAEGIVGHEICEPVQEVRYVDVNQALDILVKNEVVASPEYWTNAVKVVKNLDLLMINMAKKLIKEG